MMALPPRESASMIAGLAKDVKISQKNVEKVADIMTKVFKENEYDVKKWKQHELHPKSMDASAVEWIFFVDTLNFSFWGEESKQHKVKFDGKEYTGYWSLCAAVNRALKAGVPILSAEYFANISLEMVQKIFQSDTETPMPLLEERQKVLNETGKCLIEKFGGSFINALNSCENSAQKLLELVVTNFPSYRDEAMFEGRKVAFYKRAQILISDIWACFEGQSFGKFNDIDSLTVFADYRVPQVLVYFGVLEYSEELLKRLTTGLLENGERLEIEIRGCTIAAVELICKAVNEKFTQMKSEAFQFNAVLADYYLWDYRRSHASEMEHIPFHKTRCIYY